MYHRQGNPEHREWLTDPRLGQGTRVFGRKAQLGSQLLDHLLGPGVYDATCSAPEVVFTNSNPANRDKIGVVASITTFRSSGPSPSINVP